MPEMAAGSMPRPFTSPAMIRPGARFCGSASWAAVYRAYSQYFLPTTPPFLEVLVELVAFLEVHLGENLVVAVEGGHEMAMLKEFYTPQEALWCMDMPRNEFFDAQWFAAQRA